MSAKVTIRKIGNSYGIILPKAALQTLRVKEGDTVYLTEAPESSLTIRAGDQEFERKMRIAEDLMDRYQNALRELAK